MGDRSPPATGGARAAAPAPALAASEVPFSTTPSLDTAPFRAGRAPFVLLPNGVTVETLTPGDATTYPLHGSFCRIHYVARLVAEDGTVSEHAFDSSDRRGAPYDFQIGAGYVLPSVEDAILLMSRGQRVRVVLPPAAAFGAAGHPPVVPSMSTIEFTVELISMMQ